MGLTFVTEPVSVSTPATSANLGPGFDALGLALTLYDDLTARVTGDRYTVAVDGQGAGELPADERHLVFQAMMATFDEAGERPPGIDLVCDNRIPQARGMGSSSAAIVGGVQLARGLIKGGLDLIDDAAALRIAGGIEGHPDNVAPCLLGGFTIAWTEPDGARAVRLATGRRRAPDRLHPRRAGIHRLGPGGAAAEVPHRDAAFNAGRSALLTHALTSDPALLFPATEDRLHQGYRAAGMPVRRSRGGAALGRSGRRDQRGGADGAGADRVPARFHPGALAQRSAGRG